MKRASHGWAGRDRSSVSADLIERILEPGTLSVVFQPILEMRGAEPRAHSLECLIRGPEDLKEADVLFEYVRRKREESRVDRACVGAALRAARSLPGSPRLSINVHASTLSQDPGFWVFLGESAGAVGIPLSRITMEIVEHGNTSDWHGLLSAVDDLKSIGVGIALDDVGHGQSNYRLILDCHPDCLKIDRYFVAGCGGDFYRQAILESLVTLARKFKARVVAEGVETEFELETVVRHGIDLVQGDLFSPPLSAYHIAENELFFSRSCPSRCRSQVSSEA